MQSDHSSLINTLARIGGAGVDQTLADRYESFKPNEQAAVLTVLTQLRSARLIPLAEDAMHSEHEAVFTSAARALGLAGGVKPIEILARQLGKETSESRCSRLAKALADIGTDEVVLALEAARLESEGEKRTIIGKQLLSLQLNSLAGQHLERAGRFARDDDYEKAIEHYTSAIEHDAKLTPAYHGRAECSMILEDFEQAVADYTSALDREPDLPRGFSNRGHCRLKLEDFQPAADDFRRAIKLDPDDGQAVTGLGIALAILGDADEGIRIVNEASDRFAQDEIYAYNVACVYGRALEAIPKDAPSPKQQQLRQEYANAAISRLQESLDLGFDDRGLDAGPDPDLASLREIEAFKKLLQPDKRAADPPPADSDGDFPSNPETNRLEETGEP